MKKYLLLLTSVAALLIYNISCNSADTSKTVELKFNLPKGTKYEYSVVTSVNMNIDTGKTAAAKNQMGFVYLFEALNDSANWKTVEATFSKISMDMDMMGRTLHFDTDMEIDTSRGPLAMMGKMFGAIKGSKFSFDMNENGEIGKISGLKEMTEKMFGGLPVPPDAINKSGLNDEELRHNIQQGFNVYPGKPIKPGDSWTKILEQSMQGVKIKSENTFTLESVNGNDAAIKQESKLSSDIDTTRQIHMTGITKGTLHYDLSNGMVTDGDLDMKMDVKNMIMKDQQPMTMNMKMKMKGKKM